VTFNEKAAWEPNTTWPQPNARSLEPVTQTPDIVLTERQIPANLIRELHPHDFFCGPVQMSILQRLYDKKGENHMQ
jgi:hypothetical protein